MDFLALFNEGVDVLMDALVERFLELHNGVDVLVRLEFRRRAAVVPLMSGDVVIDALTV